MRNASLSLTIDGTHFALPTWRAIHIYRMKKLSKNYRFAGRYTENTEIYKDS